MMAERVARAILPSIANARDFHGNGALSWDEAVEDDEWAIEAAFVSARAAIAAMRTHTLVYRQDGAMVHELRGAPDDIWKTLIDAALCVTPEGER